MCNHDHTHDEVQDKDTRDMLSRRRAIQALAAGGIVTVGSTSLTACTTNPETGRTQAALMPESQLNQLAAASWAEAKAKTPVSTDPRYTTRIRNIGTRIARGANRGDQSWDYAVFDTDTKNAFVLPGNRVGFYKGMMDFTDNDDQIAAIMGHEVGHVTGSHARERVSQQLLGQVAVAGGTMIAGSQLSKRCRTSARTQTEYNRCMRSASRNTQLINAAMGMGLAVGVVLPFSRKHELESDKLGALYMKRAGYNPNEAVRLWEKMAENSPRRQPEFLSTHPDPSRRAKELHDYIRAHDALGSQGWQSYKIPKAS